jgi:transcriptional regulator with PAS, ATPase and Fis domain
VEKAAIREALDRHRGNKSKAAQYLGISRKTLTRKLKRFEAR